MSASKIDADRPYVICHVFMSIDGRISGKFMSDPAASSARGAYARMQREFEADAVMYGSVTTREFVGGFAPRFESHAAVEDGDYVAPHKESAYYLSIDPLGEIAWQTGTFRRAGRPDAHVIELLTEQTPRAYRSYLQRHGVSYIIAGSNSLDFGYALRRTKALFGISTVLVCGGGVTDLAVLAADSLDELSLVIAPVASGERNAATLFDESTFAPGGSYPFKLDRIERIEDDGLHVVYRSKR